MSIDIDWQALTEGPNGEALAESIRSFIHDRFQQMKFPRLIRSVKVTAFDFGSVGPEVELKDVCDPLPEFYDDEEDDDQPNAAKRPSPPLHGGHIDSQMHQPQATSHAHNTENLSRLRLDADSGDHLHRTTDTTTSSPVLSRVATPGIPGGTSSLNYFHMPLAMGLSGTTTPLAAISGARLGHGWPSGTSLSHLDSLGILSPRGSVSVDHTHLQNREETRPQPPSAPEDTNVNDVQIVFRVKYSGNIKLSLATEILLDYPMPSFVGIPVNLNVTGLTFDGVGIVAYIKRKAHFCFLGPEDADALIGGANANPSSPNEKTDEIDTMTGPKQSAHVGGLFEEIRVESEIGERNDSKQILKNVGTVEKFILQQVTSIFETELVYPSYWTFLV